MLAAKDEVMLCEKTKEKKNVQHCSSEMYQKSSCTDETTSVMVS